MHSTVPGTFDVLAMHTERAYQRRYHCLLARSPLKNARDHLFRFLNYVSAHAPPQRALIQCLSAYLCLQIFLLSILVLDAEFWSPTSTPSGFVVNIFSVVATFAPSSASDDTFLTVALCAECGLMNACLSDNRCL
jgi:hypothetical protein